MKSASGLLSLCSGLSFARMASGHPAALPTRKSSRAAGGSPAGAAQLSRAGWRPRRSTTFWRVCGLSSRNAIWAMVLWPISFQAAPLGDKARRSTRDPSPVRNDCRADSIREASLRIRPGVIVRQGRLHPSPKVTVFSSDGGRGKAERNRPPPPPEAEVLAPPGESAIFLFKPRQHRLRLFHDCSERLEPVPRCLEPGKEPPGP